MITSKRYEPTVLSFRYPTPIKLLTEIVLDNGEGWRSALLEVHHCEAVYENGKLHHFDIEAGEKPDFSKLKDNPAFDTGENLGTHREQQEEQFIDVITQGLTHQYDERADTFTFKHHEPLAKGDRIKFRYGNRETATVEHCQFIESRAVANGEWRSYMVMAKGDRKTKTNDQAKRSRIAEQVEAAKQTVDEIMHYYHKSNRHVLKHKWPFYTPYKANDMTTTKEQVEAGKAMQATNAAGSSVPQSDFRQLAITWKNEYPELTQIIKNLAHESADFERRMLEAQESAKGWQRRAEGLQSNLIDRGKELSDVYSQRDIAKENTISLVNRIKGMNEAAKAMQALMTDRIMTRSNYARFQKLLLGFIQQTNV